MSHIDSALKRVGPLNIAGTREMRASGVYNKLAFLTAITAVSGAISASMVSKSASLQALVLPCIVVAMGCALAGSFKPNWAKTVAPIYALVEGVILGVVSKYYATTNGGVVPASIVLTGALFIGCLLVFRTGVVKVTPRFVSMVSIGMMALFALYVASMFGLSVPGINDLGPAGMVFGIIGLALGLGRLFIDFERVRSMEENGRTSDGVEWFLSFQLLLSLVMIYVNVLRILGAGGRRD